MHTAQHRDLSRRERQILDILYERGPLLVADICEALPDPLSGSAVRAMLKRLEDKGYVTRDESERGFLYSPTVSDSVGERISPDHERAGF